MASSQVSMAFSHSSGLRVAAGGACVVSWYQGKSG
jgi:hypothetical protein